MCLSACNYEADRYIIDVEDLKTESITARESYAVQEEDAIHEEPVPIEEVLAQNATSYNGQSLQYEYVLSDGKILRIDADKILKLDVKEIYCMMTYTLCDIETVTAEMTSKERVVHGTEDYLTFIRVDKELNEEEYFFEGSKLEDLEYVRSQFQNGKKDKLDLGRLNLTPVIEAFKKKKLC